MVHRSESTMNVTSVGLKIPIVKCLLVCAVKIRLFVVAKYQNISSFLKEDFFGVQHLLIYIMLPLKILLAFS